MAKCPSCGRELAPRPKGCFKIMCWPRHKMGVYPKRQAGWNEWNVRNEPARDQDRGRDNEIDCPMSGQPVD